MGVAGGVWRGINRKENSALPPPRTQPFLFFSLSPLPLSRTREEKKKKIHKKKNYKCQKKKAEKVNKIKFLSTFPLFSAHTKTSEENDVYF